MDIFKYSASKGDGEKPLVLLRHCCFVSVIGNRSPVKKSQDLS